MVHEHILKSPLINMRQALSKEGGEMIDLLHYDPLNEDSSSAGE